MTHAGLESPVEWRQTSMFQPKGSLPTPGGLIVKAFDSQNDIDAFQLPQLVNKYIDLPHDKSTP